MVSSFSELELSLVLRSNPEKFDVNSLSFKDQAECRMSLYCSYTTVIQLYCNSLCKCLSNVSFGAQMSKRTRTLPFSTLVSSSCLRSHLAFRSWTMRLGTRSIKLFVSFGFPVPWQSPGGTPKRPQHHRGKADAAGTAIQGEAETWLRWRPWCQREFRRFSKFTNIWVQMKTHELIMSTS